MGMSRRWPIPSPSRTIHIVGDPQGISATRKGMVLADLALSAVPDVAHRVCVGDLVAGQGEAHRFPAAIAFMDAMGSGQWWSCVGNHDYDYQSPTPDPDAAAANMGMPGKDFSVDLGYAVLVVTYVRAASTYDPSNPYDPTWLGTELDKYPDRTCLVVAHPPLVKEFADDGGTGLAPEVDAIMAVLDSRPQAKAWLSGHTHWGIEFSRNLALTVDTGSRAIAQINGGSLYYTTPGVDWTDRLWSAYLTVESDRLEVRFRDHGAHQWVNANGGGRLWTFPL